MENSLRKVTNFCIFLFLMFALTGCYGNKSVRILTESELAEANQAFSDPQMCCFFTCHYATPAEIDLFEFLKYCPGSVMLTDADAEEFQDWIKAAHWPDPDGIYEKPSEFYIPVRRLANENVSEILVHYAGITTKDLLSFGNAVYLEKYDSFYNYTTDYAPGYFECVGGGMNDQLIWFWSEPDADGTRQVLTMKQVNDVYLIRSFLREPIE